MEGKKADKKRREAALARFNRNTQLTFAGAIRGYFDYQFRKDLMELTPKERVDAMIKLAPYAFPRIDAAALPGAAEPGVTDRKKSKLAALAREYEYTEAEEVS